MYPVTGNKIVTARFVARPADEPDVEGLNLAEYFWDAAPTEGNGTRIPLAAIAVWRHGPAHYDVSGLAPGMHQIGFRVRDQQRRWSDVAWSPVMVESASALLAAVSFRPEAFPSQRLVASEWFWDTDPGAGKGTPVPVATAESWQGFGDSGWQADVSGLSVGLHRLGVRSRDASGRWSDVAWDPVDVQSGIQLLSAVDHWPAAETNHWLVAAEYFWDRDPGFGRGTGIPMEAGESTVPGLGMSAPITANVSGLGVGLHQLGFRSRDAMGRWTGTEWVPFKVELSDDLTAGVARFPALEEDNWLVAAEYFWDDDPGEGRGQPVAVPGGPSWGRRIENLSQLDVPVPSLPLGAHRLGVRARDSRQRWSAAAWTPVWVERQPLLTGMPPLDGPAAGQPVTGIAVGDWNADGLADVFALGGAAPSGLFDNSAGVLTANPTSDISGLAGVQGAAWADADNDGLEDLAVAVDGGLSPLNTVFRNSGGGHFTANGTGAFPGSDAGSRGVAWADFDRDGFVDLVVATLGGGVRLYRNLGGTSFADASAAAGFGPAPAGSVSARDFDGDGFPDLLVTGPDGARLYRNTGGLVFSPVNLPAAASVAGILGGVWIDPDNDLRPDFLIAGNPGTTSLFHNNGDGTFAQASVDAFPTAAIGADAAVATDIDLDGWQDIVVALTSGGVALFHNRRDGTFGPAESIAAFPVDFGVASLAVADVDRNGVPDLVAGGVNGTIRVATNSVGTTSWLKVRPRSVSSNRSALGARITVSAVVDGVPVAQSRELVSGNGFGGGDERLPVFGLGDATVADVVRVDWPSGLKTELRNVAANQELSVDEVSPGSPIVRVNGVFRADNAHEFTDTAELEVTLTSEFPGANLFYTLDGTAADVRSVPYTGAFRVRPPGVIRATAFSGGYLDYAEAEPVRLVFIPSYAVSVSTEGGGTVSVTPLQGVYRRNSVVQMTAVPAVGWVFMRWEGDLGGAGPVKSLTVDSAKSVRAVFGTPLSASVTGGSANGTVVVEPSAGPYPYGSLVRLSAIPAADRSFAQWNASPVLTNSLLTVRVTDPATKYNAVFGNLRAGRQSLALLVGGRGTIQASPQLPDHPQGSSVLLTAVADPGWIFESWSGGVAGTQPVVNLAMDTSVSVTALFRRNVPQTPPSINVQPSDLVRTNGQTADFAVAAAGSIPMNFQWYFDGTPIPGAALPTLSVPGLRALNKGGYQAVVWNDYGQATSRVAQLVVVKPPNAVPLVAMRTPIAATTARYPTNLPLSAWTVDPDGTIDRLEFYADGALLGTGRLTTVADTYGIVWSTALPGVHAVYAKAVDSEGGASLTVPIEINVLPPEVTRVTFESPIVSVTESTTVLRLRVLKSGLNAGSVYFNTRSRSAQLNRDYREASGRLDFLAGDTANFVEVQLLDEFVADGTKEFDVSLGLPDAGIELGENPTIVVSIQDNDGSLETTSFLDFHPSSSRVPIPGQLQVTASPPEAGGQWRLAWENVWRASGTVLTNLDPGNYVVEFRPAFGFHTPSPVTNAVAAAVLAQVAQVYSPDPAQILGAVGVDLVAAGGVLPPDPIGWRFVGEIGWRPFGSAAGGRPPGSDVVEFRPAPGWIAPVAMPVRVQPGLTALAVVEYTRIPDVIPGASVPVPLDGYSFIRQAQSDVPRMPLPMVGQLRTPAGFGSGIVVRQRVVLTAAHVLFDESTGAFVDPSTIEWRPERQAGNSGYEPVPIRAAGYYVNENYAAARLAERQSLAAGVTPLSQEWDVAAIYFDEPVARDGQSGYLLSSDPGEWLHSGNPSLLAGYPFGTGAEGKMHRTAVFNYTFQPVSGASHVFGTDEIQGLPGNSGGPLLMLFDRGGPGGLIYFPAAVFLGRYGDQSVFRVIDGTAVQLVNRAASSALLGLNFAFGGALRSGTDFGAAFSLKEISFRFDPSGAAPSAGWRLRGDSSAPFVGDGVPVQIPSAITKLEVEFKPVPGLPTPAPVDMQLAPGVPWTFRVAYGVVDSLSLAPIADRVVPEQTLLSIGLSASKGNNGSLGLQFGLAEGPTGLSVAATGNLSWTPTEAQGPSTNVVKVYVGDGLTTVTNQFVVVVLEVNLVPKLAPVPNQMLDPGSSLALRLAASDDDLPKATLLYSLVRGPLGMTVNPPGQLNWSPTPNQRPSTNSVVVSVSDGLASANREFVVVALGNVPAPSLEVWFDADQLVVSWPVGSGKLQSNGDLGDGNGWSDVSGSPVVEAGKNRMRVAVPGSKQFFRVLVQ